ncbi:MAG TPA: hypothetical protein VM327_06905 [Candidatus Thermoplasmatota archaeon]|nr:hypothetical protein [Candidatus Thermoplasmatota archaeon]
MRILCILLIVALVPVAGCVSSTDAPAPETIPLGDSAPVKGAGRFLAGAYSAKECVEGGIILLLPPAQAQTLLPDGFAPRDASGLFGLPLASGMAAIYLNAQGCISSNATAGAMREAQVNVYVQPPIPGLAAAFDFYELTFVSPNPEVVDHFASVAWLGDVGTVEVTLQALPSGAAVQGSGSDSEGVLFDFDIVAPAENPLDGIGRFWRVTESGLPYAEHRLTTTLAVGSVECTLRPGSPWANAYQGTKCRPGESAGLLLLPFDYEATFHIAP